MACPIVVSQLAFVLVDRAKTDCFFCWSAHAYARPKSICVALGSVSHVVRGVFQPHLTKPAQFCWHITAAWISKLSLHVRSFPAAISLSLSWARQSSSCIPTQHSTAGPGQSVRFPLSRWSHCRSLPAAGGGGTREADAAGSGGAREAATAGSGGARKTVAHDHVNGNQARRVLSVRTVPVSLNSQIASRNFF